ncbi:peroxidasin-like protein [Centruroides sculpturatus]|uniref:peroxidasin-like protein n=1 Tax=Centruroides sculpturatus TaxID=218467 RepID=UPI000C6DFA1A|nr:peroxidasin-like protein [Centruroides sculpturatus]
MFPVLVLVLLISFLEVGRCTGMDSPRIRPFGVQGRIPVNEKAALTCISAGNSLEFKWLFNGKDISNSSTVRIKHEHDYSTIIIDPVRMNTEGNYTCIAKNSVGVDSFTTELLVEAPPQWIEEPQDTTVILENSVIIKCSAIGSPVPNVTWRKISADNKKTANTHISENGTLHFNAIKKADSGTYECEANNGINPSIKKQIIIKVQELFA